MSRCDFNKVAKQLHWNNTSAWVFSCKFAEYFQSTFPKNTSGWLLLKKREAYFRRLTRTSILSEEKAARIRYTNWIKDTLRKLVGNNLERTEILDYNAKWFSKVCLEPLYFRQTPQIFQCLQNGQECLSKGSWTRCSRRNIRARASLKISCYACQNTTVSSVKCTKGFSVSCHGRCWPKWFGI